MSYAQLLLFWVMVITAWWIFLELYSRIAEIMFMLTSVKNSLVDIIIQKINPWYRWSMKTLVYTPNKSLVYYAAKNFVHLSFEDKFHVGFHMNLVDHMDYILEEEDLEELIFKRVIEAGRLDEFMLKTNKIKYESHT